MPKVRIIVSSIEHESILETAKGLEQWGVEVIYLPVTKNGLVDLKKLKSSLNENTVLVSIMYANNETGVIQPIAEISKIISEFRRGAYPLFHTDASQAFQYLDCSVSGIGVDLMTLSAHKIYGPKGAAALYVKNKNPKAKKNLYPSLSGGGQEFDMRSGTENVPAIVGFAKAVLIAEQKREAESKRIASLRDRLLQGIKKIYRGAELNGDKGERLPNNINIYLPGIKAEEFLIKLDMAGIAIGTGSACKARALERSHVLEAMGFKEPRTKNSLRFSLGRPTSKAEVDKVLQVMKMIERPKQ